MGWRSTNIRILIYPVSTIRESFIDRRSIADRLAQKQSVIVFTILKIILSQSNKLKSNITMTNTILFFLNGCEIMTPFETEHMS